MRVAVLCDVHGNLPALNAVLREVREARVDRVVVGGDVVPGPMCVEVLARLQDLDVPTDFVRGNGEVAVSAQRRGEAPPGVPTQYLPIIEWTARQLEDEQAQFIAAWPMTVSLSIAGLGDVLFCHSTPRDEFEIFLQTTAAEKLLPVFSVVRESIVVCGHTHMQFDRMAGRHRIVNAGSVGMPFGPPGADWLLLGPGVELRHTNYDLAAAASVVRESGYPDAENFAATNILDPPTAERMIELFTPAELR
ncbi:MAG TPA: metallophosphoesterase family protein [Vicinamibacterales bacterium]|nr:metallophosphoesterase family protein [Vicinamibacterales bacterium]